MALWQLEDVHALSHCCQQTCCSSLQLTGDVGCHLQLPLGPCRSLALQELEVTDLGVVMAKGEQRCLPRERMEKGELIEHENSHGEDEWLEEAMVGDEKAVEQNKQISKQRKCPRL